MERASNGRRNPKWIFETVHGSTAYNLARAGSVAALPGIAEAHAKGEISNNQLGAVAAIASASSEGEAWS